MGNIIKQAVEHIADPEKKELVTTILDKTLTLAQKEALNRDKSKAVRVKTAAELDKFKIKIKAIDERNQTAEGFAKEFITMMEIENLEEDLNGGVENGAGDGSYLDDFMKLCGGVGAYKLTGAWEKYADKGNKIEWVDEATFNACIEEFKKVVRGVPTNVQGEIRDRYVNEFISQYAKAIGDKNNKKIALNQVTEVINSLLPKQRDFQEWLKVQNPPLKMEDVINVYTLPETQQMLEVLSGIAADKKIADAIGQKKYKDYYTNKILTLEKFAGKDFAVAQKQLTELEGEMSAYSLFATFGEQFDEAKPGLSAKYKELLAKHSGFNPNFLVRIKALQAIYDKSNKDLELEKAQSRRLKILDLTDLKTTQMQLDAEMSAAAAEIQKKADDAAKPTPAALEAKAAAEANEEQPDGFDELVVGTEELQTVAKHLAQLPLIGGFILSSILAPKTLRDMGIKTEALSLGSFFNFLKTPKTPVQLKKIEKTSKDFLAKHFQIKTVGDVGKLSEMDVLSGLTVKSFLENPPDILKKDKSRYDKLVAAVKAKGGTTGTTGKVFDFVFEKIAKEEKTQTA